MHVALLGDSILDNGRYVRGKPAVSEQLGDLLAARGGRVTLLARDGDRVGDVLDQLAGLPQDATHLIVSAGGNDALDQSGLLDREMARSSELLGDLATVHARFAAAYRAMLDALRATGKPFAVCTIYDSNFEQPRKALADTALSVFNDVILRCAGEAGAPVVDLRRVFAGPADYANPIEPNEVGGAKMVALFAAVCRDHDFGARRCVLYP
ncbi:MAG: SGNH/GDSL hydrolase family protein [Planctomycetes bacterium]|nr:SGNH/GDSL hydrolase family protein [Planctomycetota bacterium]